MISIYFAEILSCLGNVVSSSTDLTLDELLAQDDTEVDAPPIEDDVNSSINGSNVTTTHTPLTTKPRQEKVIQKVDFSYKLN